MTKIKVLLVDDHTVVRQGLRALLHGRPGNIEKIVAEASTGREAMQMAKNFLQTSS